MSVPYPIERIRSARQRRTAGRRLPRRKHDQTTRRLMLEPLESRMLLTVDLSGMPVWVEQGPGTITNGNNVEGIPDRPQAGAVNSLAPDPTDPDRLFVGSTNGGIWRTNNATAANPTWEPLTDQFPGLSIGAIAFSPLDPTRNTLYAGAGDLSSGGGDGGPRIGLLKTVDGGDTWTLTEQTVLPGNLIVQVIPTSLGTPATQVVLVATNNGVFRSTDGGVTFDAAPALAGNIRDLDADPGNPNNFYAAIGGTGFFLSPDGGETWDPVNSNIPAALIANSEFAEMAVHNSPGNNAVYAILFDTNATNPAPPPATITTLTAFRSTNQGTSWTQMDQPPQLGRPRRTSITADPVDPNVVFISSVVGQNLAGCARPSGRVTRGDASLPAGTQWLQTVCVNANGTSPHPDSRDLVFDANGDLLEANDGGVYRLVDPNNGVTRFWESVNGDLRTVEFYSVSYDSLNDATFGGTQDNGTPRQTLPGPNPGDPPPTFTWDSTIGGDGGVTQVDNTSANCDFVNPCSIHYGSAQGLGGPRREEYDAANVMMGSTPLALNVNGAPGKNLLSQDANGNPTFDPSVVFIQPWALNAVDPTRLLIGTNFLYESSDRGDTITSVGGVANLNGDGLDNDNDAAIDEGDEWAPTNPIGQVNRSTGGGIQSNPIAYGGTAGGVPNPAVIWMGAGNSLLLRTSGAGLPVAVPEYTAAGGAQVQDVVMDPDDWHRALIVDVNGRVFQALTDDPGTTTTVTELTGNLPAFTHPALGLPAGNSDLRTIELVRSGLDEVLLVGGQEGVYRAINPTLAPVWSEVGQNLPNAIAYDLRYDATDDLLLVGTFGRGAWTIADASAVLPQPGTLNICGDEDQVNQDDVFLLERNAGNPALLDVFINGVLAFSGPLAAIEQINVFGVGGNDNLIVDSTNGLINVVRGIRYNGDGKCPASEEPDGGAGYNRGFDRLTFVQENGPDQTSSTYRVGPQIGSGTYTIVGAGLGDTQTVFFEELEPVTDVVPAITHTIYATPENNAINYTVGPNSGLVNIANPAGDATAIVTLDNYESNEFANKTSVTINALAGADAINIDLVPTPTGLSGAITVDGGDPGVSDTLTITGTPAVETFEYVPDAVDGGTFVLPGPDVVFQQITAVAIDGRSDLNDDTLIVRTETGADTVTLIPGSNVDSGSFHISAAAGTESTPTLTFRALGQDAFVQLLSGGGAGVREDSFEYRGTDTADVFSVTAADGGTIVLDARKAVRAPSTLAVVLDGLDGDDTFNVSGQHPFSNGITVAGGSPSASDTLNFERDPAGSATVVVSLDAAPAGPSLIQTVQQPGSSAVTLVGIETANIDANTADVFVSGTRLDDEITFTPWSPDSAALTAAGIATRFRFDEVPSTSEFRITGGGTGLGGPVGGGFADKVVFEGTNGSDRIRVNSPTRFVQLDIQAFGFPPPILATWRGVTLDDGTSPFGAPGIIETVEVRGRDGDDTFHVVPGNAVGNGLFVKVDGGSPPASDALVIAGLDAANNPIPLAAADFVVDGKSRVPDAGNVLVFQGGVRRPGIAYQDVEVLSPNVFVSAAGDPNLLVLGPDLFEENEFRTTAAFLGSGNTLNVENLAIFPNSSEYVGVPADQDWFRVVAPATGTLDFQVYFRQFDPALLPAGGDVDIEVRDASGDLITGFGANDADDNERVRIPAVEGQTYYLRVFGATGNVVNGYDLTVVSTPAPVPIGLELDDRIFASTVAAAPVPLATAFDAAPFAPVVPGSPLPEDDGFNGKYLTFLSGDLIGQRGLVVDFLAATRTFVFAPGTFTEAPAAGDLFQVESVDAGRSQFDNVTRDTTPTIFLRVPDAALLLDIPDNGTAPGLPPDETIPIPFVADTSVDVPDVPAAGPRSGFRVAVFVTEENTHDPTLAGYAQPVDPAGLPGVYSFTFADPLAPNGSYFISARVEMIDPARNVNGADGAEQAQGFGGFATSLEIVVDTAPPPVFFGNPAVDGDGLVPDPGVIPQPPLFDDNKTNDTTPEFWGTAEADAVIRVYADNEVAAALGNGTLGVLDEFDVLIGLTVALPEDGTNQFPHGRWRVSSTVDLNDEDFFAPADGLRTLFVTAEDVPGNVNAGDLLAADTLQVFVDTQGPQVTGMFATNLLGLLPGNALLRFNAASPYAIEATLPITGLLAGDTVVGVDVRPADGQVYAVADGPDPDALYTVHPVTGAATFVASLSMPLSGTAFGVDFDPVLDTLRIVSDADINYSVNPVSGIVTPQAALNPGNPNIAGVAYTNSTTGALFTSLYTLDFGTDVLNLQNPAVGGTQTLVGPLGINISSTLGFDVAPSNNIAFAALTSAVNGRTGLYTIGLSTGQATFLGYIRDGATPLLGLAAISEYDIFDPKPSTDGPTPLLTRLFVRLQDLPGREDPFDNPAVNPPVAETVGHYTLIGDANGIIPIESVQFIPDPVVQGEPATGTIVLEFFEPLPDDRFSLILNDSIVDDVGNALDGESNADEPQESPAFPSGDGQPGGDFVARFTVDSRPEVGTAHSGSVWVDTNGNFTFDPDNPDFTNRDIVYVLGFTTDNLFAGNFSDPVPGAISDGFDKLAAYGRVGSNFRWLIDTDNDGVPNPPTGIVEPNGTTGFPVAGNFDGNPANGDEVGMLGASTWRFDTNHDFLLDTSVTLSLTGLPIVGDFDGDGYDDLGTWQDDQFTFLLTAGTDRAWLPGGADPVAASIGFGFIGVRERPVAADLDQDGIDDIGLWVPDRAGVAPVEQGEWYFLMSNDFLNEDDDDLDGDGMPDPDGVPDPDRTDGTLVTLDHPFEPVPFGNDLFASFGDEFAVPVLGNFDPPVSPTSTAPTLLGTTNLDDPYDINGDKQITALDVLVLINEINAGGTRTLVVSDLSGPYLDPNADGLLTAADVLIVVNQINRDQTGAGEGEMIAASVDTGAESGIQRAASRTLADSLWHAEWVGSTWAGKPDGSTREPLHPDVAGVDRYFADRRSTANLGHYRMEAAGDELSWLAVEDDPRATVADLAADDELSRLAAETCKAWKQEDSADRFFAESLA